MFRIMLGSEIVDREYDSQEEAEKVVEICSKIFSSSRSGPNIPLSVVEVQPVKRIERDESVEPLLKALPLRTSLSERACQDLAFDALRMLGNGVIVQDDDVDALAKVVKQAVDVWLKSATHLMFKRCGR